MDCVWVRECSFCILGMWDGEDLEGRFLFLFLGVKNVYFLLEENDEEKYGGY